MEYKVIEVGLNDEYEGKLITDLKKGECFIFEKIHRRESRAFIFSKKIVEINEVKDAIQVITENKTYLFKNGH